MSVVTSAGAPGATPRTKPVTNRPVGSAAASRSPALSRSASASPLMSRTKSVSSSINGNNSASVESGSVSPVTPSLSPATRSKYAHVKSRVGSLDNVNHSPPPPAKKIVSVKLDFDKNAAPRIEARSAHKPKGGDVKVFNEKLSFNDRAAPKVEARSEHKPKGGDVKIFNEKLSFKDNAAPRVDAKSDHKAGGGDIKIFSEKVEVKAAPRVDARSDHKAGGGDVKIFNEKVEVKAAPRVDARSDHKAGGGDVKIFNEKVEVKAAPRVDARSDHKAGGGDVKIFNEKVEVKAAPRVDARSDHKAGGGNVKIFNEKVEVKAAPRVDARSDHRPGGGDVRIFNEKVEVKAGAKVGSLANVEHVPGGSRSNGLGHFEEIESLKFGSFFPHGPPNPTNQWYRPGSPGSYERLPALHREASAGNLDAVRDFLARHCVDPTVRDGFGRTALHVAASAGHADVVELLATLVSVTDCGTSGRVVEMADSAGNTPLHAAVLGGHLDCVLALLRAGADARCQDRLRRTPVDLVESRVALMAGRGAGGAIAGQQRANVLAELKQIVEILQFYARTDEKSPAAFGDHRAFMDGYGRRRSCSSPAISFSDKSLDLNALTLKLVMLQKTQRHKEEGADEEDFIDMVDEALIEDSGNVVEVDGIDEVVNEIQALLGKLRV
ncbi:hypothetical protein HK101_005519 [Irineochytrium annulatum]|nr:hypothetical protein HK101_005519 [Irineochytrium annulatum]